MDKIYNKDPTDVELILVDDHDQIIINVHKNVLTNESPYFEKLFTFGIESTSNKITIHVPNRHIAFDLVMLFYLIHEGPINPCDMMSSPGGSEPRFSVARSSPGGSEPRFSVARSPKTKSILSILLYRYLISRKNPIVLEQIDNFVIYPIIGHKFNCENNNSANLPTWKYTLEMIKCRNFFGLKNSINLLLLKNIRVPDEEFEQLINVVEIVGFNDKTIKIINKNLPTDYDISRLSNELINEIVAIESNYFIVSCGSDDIKLWNIETDTAIINFDEDNSNWKKCISISSDDKWIVSCGYSTIIKLWDVDTGQIIRIFHDDTWVEHVSFSSNNKWIASASDRHVKLWNVDDGKIFRSFIHTDYVYCVAFSSDDKWIICGGRDSKIQLWHIESSDNLKKTYYGHNKPVYSVSFSSDNKWIISGSNDDSIKLWDTNSGQIIRTFNGHKNSVVSVSFSLDNKWILSASGDRSIKLWNMENGQIIRTFDEHLKWMTFASLSLDNKYIVSCDIDNIIKVWDVRTGQVIRSFNRCTDRYGVYCVLFSKNKYPNELAKKLMKYID